MMPRRHNKLLVRLSIFALVCFLMPASLLAGVGQIKGQITDKETGDPVIQASVLVVGTKIGAMTDLDGKYVIARLEPGTYTIRISHLDYQTVELTDIDVKSDLTTEQNRKMTGKVTELDDVITVRGEVDIIDKFEISNQTTISAAEIESKPVESVEDLLTQVAGVVKNESGEIFIRGGRAGEVAYIDDGVPLGDPLGEMGGQAGANLSLVSGSIQEFTVIKDGFDPEYGDALSGIVRITTQTGSKDNTSINMRYMTDDLGNSTLNKYSINYDYLRFKLSGPDPILKTKILPALGLNFLEDKEFTYFFYAEVTKNDGIHQYEDFDTPTISRRHSTFNLLGLDIPERLNNKYYWMLNVKFRPKQNMRFILSYKDSKDRWTSFNWNYLYTPNTAPVLQQEWRSASLEVSQTIRRNISYEALLSYSRTFISQRPGDPTNPGKGLDPDDFVKNSEWERFDDNNGNGVYDPPEPIINLYPDTVEYGYGFSGPAYTYGEWNLDFNAQAGRAYFSDFRFNNNGLPDLLEGEPFIDYNENGVWDAGDYLYDKNGNGILDGARIKNVDTREPEPFIDGDSIIGEEFIDLNGNDIYDYGIDLFVMSADSTNMDINHNGKYDGPVDRNRDGIVDELIWTRGVRYLDRNGNGVYDSPNKTYELGEPFIDVNGNGVRDDGGEKNFLSPNNHVESARWHHRSTSTYRGELKAFWQLGSHELKGGFSIQRDFLEFRDIEQPHYPYNGRSDGGPYADRGAFRDMFDYEPWKGTVYFRDKLEYGSMIASLGFRWDYFIQDRFALVDVAREDDLGSGVILGDRQKFSPRIGFSYPISDKAKIHFNYGHFYQLPSLLAMYQRNTVSVDRNKVIGNYNLDYQKTVQYSFGVKYAMNENYSIDLSGYFKDEFDKVNSAPVQIGSGGGMTFQQYQNSDYGRSRGFEVQIEKRGGGYVNGSLNYSYAFSFGKASEANQDYLGNEELNRQPLSESPLDNDIRHRLQANIQFFVPSTVKPRLFGLPIPNGWSLAVETLIESGRPFTPGGNYPNLAQIAGEDIQRNVLRKPSTIVFDLRLTKDFEFVGMDYSFIAQVENVFDSRNVVNVYTDTGRPDTQQIREGNVHGGTAYDLNPANWDYGRQIRLGIEVNL